MDDYQEDMQSEGRDVDLAALMEEGKIVFDHLWNTGGMYGSGHDQVYEYGGDYYYVYEMSDVEGPFGSLEEALSSFQMCEVGSATVSFTTILPSEDLEPFLSTSENLDDDDLPFSFQINGEAWEVTEDREIQPVE